MSQHSKAELEAQISQVKTLGIYFFDEDRQVFTSNVAIGLVIQKIEDKVYQAYCYYFDGYECGVTPGAYIFEGTEEEARAKAIKSWNEPPELFMDYPIIYENVICEVYEEA